MPLSFEGKLYIIFPFQPTCHLIIIYQSLYDWIYHSEGDQPWDFFGRTDAKAETPVLWPPHAKS